MQRVEKRSEGDRGKIVITYEGGSHGLSAGLANHPHASEKPSV